MQTQRVVWRQIRSALGLTQDQMAELVGVSARTVRRLECGASPRPATLTLLRYCLQIPDMQRQLDIANCPHPWPEDACPEDARAGQSVSTT